MRIIKHLFLQHILTSGLMPNHLYTVTISRINRHGKSKPSKPLAFRTKCKFHVPLLHKNGCIDNA